MLSKPPQRITIEEAHAQQEKQAEVSPVDGFRVPASKREATAEVVSVPREEADGRGCNDEVPDKVVKRREARRSREVKVAQQQVEEEGNRDESTGNRREQSDVYAQSANNITADTSNTRPNTGATTGVSSIMVDVPTDVHTADRKSEYRSPVPPRRSAREETAERETHHTASETQKQAERETTERTRGAGERTREQDRSRVDTSTDGGGAEQLAQEKANILAQACQRGALEFLQSFATADTSFLTVGFSFCLRSYPTCFRVSSFMLCHLYTGQQTAIHETEPDRTRRQLQGKGVQQLGSGGSLCGVVLIDCLAGLPSGVAQLDHVRSQVRTHFGRRFKHRRGLPQ
jgi:hypothetical protein